MINFREAWKRAFGVLIRKPSTKSAKPAKVELVERDGRVFLLNSTYLGAADEQEVDRLNQQHYMLRYLIRTNCVAPIDTIPLHDVLDVGTGSGIWCLEMAHDYPSTAFVGVDINTAHLPTTVVPKNVSFQHGDVLKGLPFPNESFDYIHARFLCMGIPRDKWPSVLKEYHRLLRPGGFLELLEPDMLLRNPGPIGNEIPNRMSEFFAATTQTDLTLFPNTCAQMIQDTGFADVKVVPLETPVGKWAGIAGGMMLEDCLTFYNAFAGPFTQYVGSDKDLYKQQLQAWRAEVDKYRSYGHIYYLVARK